MRLWYIFEGIKAQAADQELAFCSLSDATLNHLLTRMDPAGFPSFTESLMESWAVCCGSYQDQNSEDTHSDRRCLWTISMAAKCGICCLLKCSLTAQASSFLKIYNSKFYKDSVPGTGRLLRVPVSTSWSPSVNTLEKKGWQTQHLWADFAG